jgi:superfamily I DNA/RNA helicase
MNTQEVPLESILEACPPILDAALLRGDYLSRPYQFVVSDALGIKGFEFSNVLIVGVEDGMFPLPGLPQAEQWRDALRLYSAMTRGRNEVHFFCRQKPSGPFQEMKRFLEHRSL